METDNISRLSPSRASILKHRMAVPFLRLEMKMWHLGSLAVTRMLLELGRWQKTERLGILKNKLNIPYCEKSASALPEALDYMPLAITQAAAYINQLGRRGSVSKYHEHFSGAKRAGQIFSNETQAISVGMPKHHTLLL